MYPLGCELTGVAGVLVESGSAPARQARRRSEPARQVKTEPVAGGREAACEQQPPDNRDPEGLRTRPGSGATPARCRVLRTYRRHVWSGYGWAAW